MEDAMMDTPFVLGKEYWQPVLSPCKVTLICNVCFGKKFVYVVLGNSDTVQVECEACGLGYERARGYTEEYQYNIGAKPFVIASISSMHGDSWYLVSDKGESSAWSELSETEQLALEWSAKRKQEHDDHNATMARHRKDRAKHLTWSVSYHEKCIREYEEKIAWHRSHVAKRKPNNER